MPALTAWVDGIGLLGPGIADWPTAARLLAGESAWARAPTVVPVPQSLPGAERRRTGLTVRLALAVGLEATARAGAAPGALPAVFTSSGGDGENCHEICQVLATAERQVSPTRFHNSVHNAAAGYWGIATGATAASTALCAYDASFGAGLLEAMTQVAIEGRTVLLIAYDTGYPEPLHTHRPLPDPFGVALVLAAQPGAASQAGLELTLTGEPATRMSDAALEALRASIPAARSLPLLALLARRAAGCAVLDYLGTERLAARVSAWR
jgi:hypothetical protein